MMLPKILKTLILFTIGFLVGLLGDYFHIASRTTFYNPDYIGFKILASAWWYPALTGAAAVIVAALHRVLQPRLDPSVSPSAVSALRLVLALLAFLVMYALSAYPVVKNLLIHDLMMLAFALASWKIFRPTRTVLALGLLFALVGTVTEMIQVRLGWFGYFPKCNEFLGVAIWTPFLYFASAPAIGVMAEYLDLRL